MLVMTASSPVIGLTIFCWKVLLPSVSLSEKVALLVSCGRIKLLACGFTSITASLLARASLMSGSLIKASS